MEILYSFKTEEQNGNEYDYIFEIKYLNLPSDAPKSDKFKWYFYSGNQLINLQFESMNANTRKFLCGTILDMENLTLTRNENVHKIKPCSNNEDKTFILSLLN